MLAKSLKTKSIAAGVIGSALLASVAFAQTPTATTDRADASAAAASGSSFQGDWRASKVVGLSVYNDNNESVGSINDLLTDKSGNIKAAVIGVGGFLGVGEHLVAVPFDKIKFVTEPVAYSGVAGTVPGTMKPAATSNTAVTNPTPTNTASTNTVGAATTSAMGGSAPAVTTAAPPAEKSNPWYPDHAVFNATKDELKALPEFKY